MNAYRRGDVLQAATTSTSAVDPVVELGRECVLSIESLDRHSTLFPAISLDLQG